MQDKTILVTGAGGSLGSVLTRELLRLGAKVRAFDIDEYGLFKLKRSLEYETQRDSLRLLLGDIRDLPRVQLAVERSDILYHCAAVKNIEVSEYNPIEAAKTNVIGTGNLVEAVLAARHSPSRFLYVSSDKAVGFSTLYGATKFVGEKFVLWADKIQDHTRFSVFRPGNFTESRGNVLEVWQDQLEQHQPLTITHPDMKRYFISVEKATALLVKLLDKMQGGEVYIPKMTEQKIMDMAASLSLNTVITGPRPGEKLKEELYTEQERHLLQEEDGLYVIRAA